MAECDDRKLRIWYKKIGGGFKDLDNPAIKNLLQKYHASMRQSVHNAINKNPNIRIAHQMHPANPNGTREYVISVSRVNSAPGTTRLTSWNAEDDVSQMFYQLVKISKNEGVTFHLVFKHGAGRGEKTLLRGLSNLVAHAAAKTHPNISYSNHPSDVIFKIHP